MEAIRQGDVLLVERPIPAGAKRIKLRPVALGEVTGHHHSFAAAPGVCLEDAVEMYEVESASGITTHVRVTMDGISLVHQEHNPHAVPPSEREVVRQVENTDWGARPVAD